MGQETRAIDIRLVEICPWSDESKFEIFGSNRRVFVRRRVGERMISACVVPTVKYGGGGVMVWGCSDIFRIQGTLIHTYPFCSGMPFPSGLCLLGLSFIFQGVLHQMTWPPQSPDLNPIEMVQEEL